MKKIRTLLYGFLIIMFLAAAMPTVAEAPQSRYVRKQQLCTIRLTKVGQRL